MAGVLRELYGAFFGISGLAVMLAFGVKLEQLIGPSIAELGTVALFSIFIASDVLGEAS